MVSVAVINTTTISNLKRNRFIWLTGYSSSGREAKAGRNSRQEREAKTVEEHRLLAFSQAPVQMQPQSACLAMAPSINT